MPGVDSIRGDYVCWKPLEALHGCTPRYHHHPEELFIAFKLELNSPCSELS